MVMTCMGCCGTMDAIREVGGHGHERQKPKVAVQEKEGQVKQGRWGNRTQRHLAGKNREMQT